MSLPDSVRLGQIGLPAVNRRVRRDFLAGAALFLATAVFLLWQNSQIAILWDLSYLLDTSWRIALGQVPYRDLPLVHPPLTFLLQAAIMRIAGRHFLLSAAYVSLVGGLGTVLAWRIALRILKDRVGSPWLVSLLLAAPLTALGIYGVYPHPIYDCDCAFAILIAIFLLQRLRTEEPGQGNRSRGWRLWIGPLLTGMTLIVPVFFKQNMGLPFLLAVVAGILLLLVSNWIAKAQQRNQIVPRLTPSPSTLLRVMAGIAATAVAAVALIQGTVGLNNYLRWTVRFAAQRRLPGFSEMLTVYQQPSFAWTLPAVGCGMILLCLPPAKRVWGRILAFCLLAAPLIGSIVYLFLNDDLDERADNLLALWPMLLIVSAVVAVAELRKGITLSRLIPFFLLAAIHGTFLSQQLWGSTYAIWPLLMLLIAQMLAAVPAAARKLVPALAVVVCATFLVCGGLYAAGHERMNYLNIPDASRYQSSLPALRGMADRGPYLTDFEELVRFANEQIPPQDGILLLPGEEPFFFATGRVPQFPVQIFDNTTDPYSPTELLDEVRKRKIRWVIVKTRLQSNEDPLPQREQTMLLIAHDYSLYRELGGYAVYRRKARNSG
jgi:hypothetical protein